eukprot:scaffold84966_cov68-Phaeocystis_antarctica.AAC.6
MRLNGVWVATRRMCVARLARAVRAISCDSLGVSINCDSAAGVPIFHDGTHRAGDHLELTQLDIHRGDADAELLVLPQTGEHVHAELEGGGAVGHMRDPARHRLLAADPALHRLLVVFDPLLHRLSVLVEQARAERHRCARQNLMMIVHDKHREVDVFMRRDDQLLVSSFAVDAVDSGID